MITIVHILKCMCIIQYVCMGELLSFPLSPNSKSLKPLATDAGVYMLSVDLTGSVDGRGTSQNHFIYSVEPCRFHCFTFSCICSGLKMYILEIARIVCTKKILNLMLLKPCMRTFGSTHLPQWARRC